MKDVRRIRDTGLGCLIGATVMLMVAITLFFCSNSIYQVALDKQERRIVELEQSNFKLMEERDSIKGKFGALQEEYDELYNSTK